ncbi:tRNA modification GTPase MnmE [Claveliimonas bilis]|uniref:tRNA modification GTPase MnmE n=1 Tax=Claveliimonas bilis TaxID=3028070 RepID=A0ABM9SEM2_9FIRM|nr:tRNA uridine-5-carboxymethylaminomethyl(34) synthesis GTPase MnmE [Claveliimonas bilis]BCZ27304.1 tRNA modification GTPase MnmE [Claveliimonas bilis]BDZ75918.1 tRNA modification GTPase MnmE [Claveliimonas bilis]
MENNHTIAAISTAMAESGIGIVRMSGEEAFAIADKIYKNKKGKRLSDQKTHTIHYGFIEEEGKVIDEVLVMLMRGPHTFTGEDTVEIDCHGGVYVVKKILEACIRNGARPAQPGEFTKRAFLNGKMDLSQAEAVIDVIQSQNDYALKSSLKQLRGSVKEKISDLRNKIIYHTAFIESALDDPEHISIDGYGNVLKKETKEIIEEIETLLKTADDGRIIREGINTVILGKPNAGKSSLLNVLLGEERAIVTEIAGTTRDILQETINLQGISLNIIDTAGIRNTDDKVEKIGVDKAKDYAKEADLIIYVVDSSNDLDENDYEIMKFIQGKKSILLLNKSDLERKVTKEEIKKICKEYNIENIPVIEISAKEEKGIDRLEEIVKEMFYHGEISFNNEIYITNIRHKTALERAKDSLMKVIESIENDMPEDFYSIDLMDAYETLGSITGEMVGEDLVNEIFSKFCMGK